MPPYRLPGVTVQVLDNPRIINLGEQDRIPAIVGLGPTTITVTDEAVQRQSGSNADLPAAYPASGVVITQIANTPGVASGALNAVLISLNGALYQKSSASVGSSGQITWSGNPAIDVNIPATNAIYYLTYSYDVKSTQFDPGVFSDKDTIALKYGEESVTTGLLTTAGVIALENGAPAVLLVQASGSLYSEAAYKTAIDKLQTKINIEQLVCVFPSGSVTRAQQESLLTYAFTHVQQMNNPLIGKERGLMSGSPSAFFASSGGFDTIGDSSTSGTYLYRSGTLTNRNNVYVVPSRVRRYDKNNNLMELDANYAAAAVAGLQAAQPQRSTPLHGFTVTGLIIEDEKWNDNEIRQLAAGGCLVLDSRGGVVTIVDAKTTDPTSADTEEISVVAQARLVKRSLRTGLKNVYTSKGKTINATTTLDVEGTTAAILQSLVNANELFGFGQQDNPSTGELKISAKQNAQEPRQIDVTCAVKYLYGLKYISVTVSTFV